MQEYIASHDGVPTYFVRYDPETEALTVVNAETGTLVITANTAPPIVGADDGGFVFARTPDRIILIWSLVYICKLPGKHIIGMRRVGPVICITTDSYECMPTIGVVMRRGEVITTATVKWLLSVTRSNESQPQINGVDCYDRGTKRLRALIYTTWPDDSYERYFGGETAEYELERDGRRFVPTCEEFTELMHHHRNELGIMSLIPQRLA